MKKFKSSVFGKIFLTFICVSICANFISSLIMMIAVHFGFGEVSELAYSETVRSNLRNVSALTGIVSFLVGAIIIALASKKIIGPVKNLSEASKKIANGEFETEVLYKPKAQDEISELIENFNNMTKELSKNEYLHKDFVANVSHEFKTPIAAIQGYAELLTTPKLPEEKRIEYAQIIVNQTMKASNLSSNLLRLSELEHNSFGLKKSQFSIDEQIRDILINLQNKWEEKKIEIDLDLDECKFSGEKNLMYQALLNVIQNAIKYNKVNGYVKITLKKEEQITITVEDAGIGMSEEDLKRAFERFYKADKSRSSDSTGMGLAIAQKIIALHSGKITAESKLKIGTCMKIVF